MLVQQPSAHIKVAIAILATIGIATFVFGAIRILNGISTPFARKPGYAFKTLDDAQKERDEKLKSDDTDADGLNDYDELYVFRTSPFLEDTDSDGVNDGTEVNNNQNPNCPQGKTCVIERPVDATTEAGTSTNYPATNPTTPTPNATTPPATIVSDEQILAAITAAFGDPSKLTPEAMAEKIKTIPLPDLKNFLLAIGIPPQLLDAADEATLRELVRKTLLETTAASVTTPTTTTPSN